MSLFAAYAGQADASTSRAPEASEDWLQLPSFNVDINSLTEGPLQKSDEEAEVAPKPKRPRKEDKHKDKKRKIIEQLPSEDFTIDKKKNKEFLTVQTISRPSAPRYHVKFYAGASKKFRKRKFRRYYSVKNKDDSETVITKKNVNTLEGSKKDENFTGFKQEGDLSQTTASYNRRLNEDRQDVKLWLEYVNFQETVFEFEKTYRKGSLVKGLRVLGERKLAILDKALTYNPSCEELLRERLNVAVSIYPSDELQAQLRILVDKDQGNTILWQGYIESTQCSMSHCNTPAVLNLYTKCLSILHKLRRNSTMEKPQLEENILKMLYQCGLFLKQAGLFEQLWTLLKLYLELNLTQIDKSKFNITSAFEEKQLVELEEVVLNSQLPLHELWLRTEKLREACHWLPYDGDCEDPQRLVFADDVNELIHPITMPENTFKLIATILTLLKIPLLPCRHSTMQELGLDYVPWALDSIESLLPIFLPLYPIDLTNKNLIIDNRLAVGPQYLKVLPGQEEYLDFVLTVMKGCADCLNGKEKIAATVWWMRFQKLLIILDKQGRFKLPKHYTKRIKSNMKALLKLEENRNNIVYFCEYALVEKEMGNNETCLNILQTTLSLNKTSTEETQTSRSLLYRTLIEVYLNQENKEIALKYLMSYVLEKSETLTITDDVLNETTLKLKHVTLQLLQKDSEKLTVVDHFLPDFLTNWFIINGWYLYLTKGAISSGSFLEQILSEMDEGWQKEVIFEFYVALLFRHCTSNPGVYKLLDEVLQRAIENYPNNLFLLSVLAKEQSISCSGCPWWKVKSLLFKTGRAFPILFLVIIASQQIVEAQESITETITGGRYEIGGSHKNRMLSIFRRITRNDVCTRRCGLVWRLYLQFVHANFDPGLCRNVYYRAVEECPWLKALYIDAAIYIPGELAQIQDLIIEKQLRLHVTPEELEVLRI